MYNEDERYYSRPPKNNNLWLWILLAGVCAFLLFGNGMRNESKISGKNLQLLDHVYDNNSTTNNYNSTHNEYNIPPNSTFPVAPVKLNVQPNEKCETTYADDYNKFETCVNPDGTIQEFWSNAQGNRFPLGVK